MSLKDLTSLIRSSFKGPSVHAENSQVEPESDKVRESPASESQPREPRSRRRAPRWVRLLLLMLVLILLGFFAVGAAIELANTGRIVDGVKICGEPVGGMTQEEALKVAESRTKPLKKQVRLYIEDKEFPISARSIDFQMQPEAMALAAYLKGRQDILPVRLFKSVFGIATGVDVPVMYTYNRSDLGKRAKSIQKEVEREPRSAYIQIESGSPDIVPAQNGIKVNFKETESAVRKALPTARRRVAVVFDYIKPELTENDIGSIVLIQLSKFKLFLFDGEEYVNDFPVAVGMPKYPTPTGRFHITYKEKNPTWLPTSEWALDKQGIPQPPGPDNPLGGYWMDIGEGIGIHATPFEGSLGEQASHGCIRMKEEDAETLFNIVEVGTPVFIIE